MNYIVKGLKTTAFNVWKFCLFKMDSAQNKLYCFSNRISVKVVCSVGTTLDKLINEQGDFRFSEKWLWVVFTKKVRNHFEIAEIEKQLAIKTC